MVITSHKRYLKFVFIHTPVFYLATIKTQWSCRRSGVAKACFTTVDLAVTFCTFSSLPIWSENVFEGLRISRKGVSGEGRQEKGWFTALTIVFSCQPVGGFVQKLINGFELHVKVFLSITCAQKLIYPNVFFFIFKQVTVNKCVCSRFILPSLCLPSVYSLHYYWMYIINKLFDFYSGLWMVYIFLVLQNSASFT